MAADLLALVLRMTLCLSAAVILVIALRIPVRKAAGPRLAYGLWLLVPLVAVSALIPTPRAPAVDPLAVVRSIRISAPPPPPAVTTTPAAPSVQVRAQGAPAAVAATPVAAPSVPTPQPAPAAPTDFSQLWLLAWAAGTITFCLRAAWLQARFVARLGRLTPDPHLPGVYHALGASAGPAVVGLVRWRIVLPAGFPQAYDAEEQALILAHERTHLRERHPLANAVAAAILAGQWFNPLAHLALRLMRIDQELACDAAVIADHPTLRADYARAMLKAGADRPISPLALG